MATTQKRRYSRPVLKKMITVNSEASIDAMENYVNRTMSALYALDVILFYIGSKEVADKANEKVHDLFAEKIQAFNASHAKYQRMSEDLDIEDMEYTQQRSQEYKIYSPLCSLYLKMMNKFEANINLMDALWLAGEMKSGEHKDKVVKASRHLRNISRQIVNISRQAMEVARNEGKAEDIQEAMNEIEVDKAIADEVVNNKTRKEEDKEAA
jgi:hypothetical protein